MSSFKKAERKSVKIKLAVTGPTGSGKTYSALRLAKGLGGKVAVIDTENGSASLYSDHFDFDVLDLKPPFTTEKYIDAINDAEKAGYNTILIDSLTHAWAGEGGLLEQKAQLDLKPGSNQWTNWGPIDKKDQALKNAFLHSSCHVIATMRSKMEYAQTESNGKKKIEKVGLAPIQRDGLSYDFTIVFDCWMDHQAEVSKDRTGLFAGKVFTITEETGGILLTWINSGKDVIDEAVAALTTAVAIAARIPQAFLEVDEAEPLPQLPSVADKTIGLFRMTVGVNKGLLIKDIPKNKLIEWEKWAKGQLDPSTSLAQNLRMVEAYLNQLENEEPRPVGPLNFDSNEEIPF